ncbi:ABC-type Co2+ transport system, permease component [Zostera marina]|uniref:ABC-type Co2+ transport system, permease component n=1 Tax=Zostera marina TaxID=29655 RepID=A0A0K9Q2I9_ZOSMR|nr:ABC-type Co2+ transport system, permease component [Zostera marina]
MESQTLLVTAQLIHHSLVLHPNPQSFHSSVRRPGRPLSRRISITAVKSPKGFGSPPPTNKKSKKQKQKQKHRQVSGPDGDEEDEDEDEDYDPDITIPEVVTNRMINRMGLSVGIPLAIGLLFFPLFYYLKIIAKVDVPNWVPFLVSFFFFGTALLGVSYGIVSASWDPLRQGSLLGWNEARRNWPVFWGSLWGGNDRSSSGRRTK